MALKLILGVFINLSNIGGILLARVICPLTITIWRVVQISLPLSSSAVYKERRGNRIPEERLKMEEQVKLTEPWIPVAAVCDMPPGTVLRVSYKGEDIAVFNAGGEFHAIGDTCTHAQQSLSEGEFFEDIHGWVVECPLHGSLFALATGAAISLPATGNAGLYAIKVEDGVVYVNPDPVSPFRL